MGNTCHSDLPAHQLPTTNPSQLDFKRVNPVIIPPSLNTVLNTIKQLTQFPDARENTGLKWFHSVKYELYVYGDVVNKRPVGECLFYFRGGDMVQEVPVLIATRIQDKNVYSPNTLLVYPDKSYYLGSIVSNGLQAPKADGNGMLVTKKFIYKGEFKNGLPEGYGTFKTKGGVLVGEFTNGEPYGKCVQRTKKGLFIGDLINKFRKTGKLISPNNQISYVNQEYNTSGMTMVEL